MTGLDRRHRADVRSMAPEAPLGLARAVCGIEVVPSGLAGCLWWLGHWWSARSVATTSPAPNSCDWVGISGSRRRCAWVPMATRPAAAWFCLPEVDGDEVLPVVDDEAAGIAGLGRVKPLCRRQRLPGAGDRRGVVGVLPDDCVHQFLLVLFRLVVPHGVNAADQVSHVATAASGPCPGWGCGYAAGRAAGAAARASRSAITWVTPRFIAGSARSPPGVNWPGIRGTARPLSQMLAPAILRILRRSACAHAAPSGVGLALMTAAGLP